MIEYLVWAFNVILYQPLFNFLVFLYNYLPGNDFGVAIIILTLIIRLSLCPSAVKSMRAQRALNEIQPKIKEIQKKYKDDKRKQAKEILELYKETKINPFGSLLPTLVQFPLLIALYSVFRRGFDPGELVNLYSFMKNPGTIKTSFLGIIDLSHPNLIIAVVAGIFQFIQTKTMIKTPFKAEGKEVDFSRIMQKQMTYFFPFLTVMILLGLPSALGLYWATGSLFLIIQQYFILKKEKNTKNNDRF